jgi:hypothetical protein
MSKRKIDFQYRFESEGKAQVELENRVGLLRSDLRECQEYAASLRSELVECEFQCLELRKTTQQKAIPANELSFFLSAIINENPRGVIQTISGERLYQMYLDFQSRTSPYVFSPVSFQLDISATPGIEGDSVEFQKLKGHLQSTGQYHSLARMPV